MDERGSLAQSSMHSRTVGQASSAARSGARKAEAREGASVPASAKAATSALPNFTEELERKAIEQALTDNRYNKTRAAAQLGITFRALRYKLKKLGID